MPIKPTRLNAPVGTKVATPETVTIIDPRHPLYDQTFPLLYFKNRQRLIPSCLICLAEGVERLIPISVTNLAVSPLTIFPLPFDLSSLHQLTKTFQRIRAQIEMECEDEQERNKPANSNEHWFGSSARQDSRQGPG